MEVAGETASPRAYEVAGQLIKSVADTTDKLLDLQKKVKDVNEDEGKTNNNVTNNALFVGSTSELSKLIKQLDSFFLSVTIDPFLGLNNIGFIGSAEKLFGTSKISPTTTFSCLAPTLITAYLLITQLLYYGIRFK